MRAMLDRVKAAVLGREAQLSVAVALVGALADWPYGYYQLLRWIVCTGAAFLAWRASKDGRTWWILAFVGLALLFNPISVVHFRRDAWAWIDPLAAAVFLVSPRGKGNKL